MKQNNTSTTSTTSSSIEFNCFYIVVDGHNVKMNFPLVADETAISDVKALMLRGVSKCAIP